jgi:HEAT repeat protein
VLVDGLDEITDARRRAKVASVLRHHQDGPYRFVVASRPLSNMDMGELHWSPSAIICTLQPLSMAQLTNMARNWFSVAGMADDAVHAFRAKVYHRTGSTMTTPMMATMLCRLFVSYPDLPLPAGLYGLYRDFVELLGAQQYLAPDDPVVVQIRAALRPYGDVAATAAEELPARIDDLLPAAAAALMADSTMDLLAMIVDGTDDLRPRQMPAAGWHELVRDTARRNGLLAEHADDLAFLHQTVAEFLVTKHIASDRRRSEPELRELFGHLRRPNLPDLTDYGVFLIAAWATSLPDLTTAVLGRVVARHGIPGCMFVAELTHAGVWVAPSVREAAIDRLVAAEPPAGKPQATVPWALAALGDEARGVSQLTELVTDRGVEEGLRLFAALKLLELPGDNGARLFAMLAEDPGLSRVGRLAVAENLAILGYQQGLDELFAFTADPGLTYRHRISAAETLGMVDDPQYGPALAGLAIDLDIGDADRTWVLRRLRDIGSPLYPKALAAIATNPAIAELGRVHSLDLLGTVGGPEYVEAIAALAVDPTFDIHVRIIAADNLVDLGDPRGERAWAILESYPLAPKDDPLSDAITLGTLRDPCGLDMLADAVSTVEHPDAVVVAMILAQADDQRGLDRLAEFAGERELAGDVRFLAATSLWQLGDPRGFDHFVDLAADSDFGTDNRIVAAMALRRSNDPRHADALMAIATDPAIDVDTRIWVAGALRRLGDPRGADQLTAIADDRELVHDVRVRAAITLGGLDDTRGADLLVALADDPARRQEIAAILEDGGVARPRLDSRLVAANALRALGDVRAAKVLATLLTERTVHVYERIRAAGVLGRLGDARGTDALAEWIADRGTDWFSRQYALRKLDALGDPRVPDLRRQLEGE